MAPPRRWPRPGRLPALSALVAVVVLAAGVPLVLAHALSPAPASPHPGVAPPQTWSTLDSSSSNSSEATFNTTY
ncbi:MAG: hypothetical protein L3K08_08870, partial [Thermoplasmata archaeon]|nr:hypothetical protein [Thermoplasmata archaeon]